MLKALSQLKFFSNVSIRIANALLLLCLTIMLARILGPEQLGVYSYTFSIVWLLSIPAQFGLPALAMRETAGGIVQSEFGRISGILIWARVFIICSASAIALLAVLVSAILTDLITPEMRHTFLWGLLLVPLFGFIALDREVLRGLGHVRAAQLANDILRPTLLIILLLFFSMTSLAPSDSTRAMALHVFAAAIALGFGTIILVRARRTLLPGRSPAEYHTQAWLRAIIPLALTAGLQQLLKQIDIAMLGAIGDDFNEVGLYRIAVQGAVILLFLQSALNMPLAPKFAQLHKANDHFTLQLLAVNSARTVALSSMLGATLFVLFGETLIELFFGVPFVSAKQPLIILAMAQVINGSFGSVGLLLNMSGNERKNLVGVSIGLGINIILNGTLIPLYGMHGAAIATAISLITWKAFLWWQVLQELGVNCSVFGRTAIEAV